MKIKQRKHQMKELKACNKSNKFKSRKKSNGINFNNEIKLIITQKLGKSKKNEIKK